MKECNDADKWFVKNSILIKNYWKLQFKENTKFERCFRSNPSFFNDTEIENRKYVDSFFLINVQSDIEWPYIWQDKLFSYVVNGTILSLEYDICY